MTLPPLFRPLLVCAVLVAGVASPRPASAVQGARETIPVLVSDAKDLQLLAFWVALGGGYFTREGIDVRVVAPDAPAGIASAFKSGVVPVAILPGPAYERLIADRFPLLLVANLFQNDPLVLVMRRDAVKRFDANSASVRRRLDFLRGSKIGVAVSDRARLYQLFHSQGLDANLAAIVGSKGNEILAQFTTGSLDAIYVPPFYAAKAIVEQDGVVYVDPAGGEVPEFGERMVQAVAVTGEFARARSGDVEAIVHALGLAEHAIHFQPDVATAALVRALPEVDPKILAVVVKTYAGAVPATPHLEAQLIKREAAFYPVGGDVLDLSGINLETVVANGKEYRVATSSKRAAHGRPAPHAASRRVLGLLAGLALALVLVVVLMDQREPRDGKARAARET
jgi:ABC-type nitrate/sulfonate/bicarbonate transport system substrate-binding protein